MEAIVAVFATGIEGDMASHVVAVVAGRNMSSQLSADALVIVTTVALGATNASVIKADSVRSTYS